MKYNYVKTKPPPSLEPFHVKPLFSPARPEATWRLQNPQSISPSQAFLSIHKPMRVQLGRWSRNHWAIHHRCLQLFGKLAAILALGTNRPAGAKMAPSKPHITKDFLHFSPRLSAPSQINIFILTSKVLVQFTFKSAVMKKCRYTWGGT